jgi:hypothetical protein
MKYYSKFCFEKKSPDAIIFHIIIITSVLTVVVTILFEIINKNYCFCIINLHISRAFRTTVRIRKRSHYKGTVPGRVRLGGWSPLVCIIDAGKRKTTPAHATYKCYNKLQYMFVYWYCSQHTNYYAYYYVDGVIHAPRTSWTCWPTDEHDCCRRQGTRNTHRGIT